MKKGFKSPNGFTFVEVVVSGLILVIAVTLMGVLFGKAGRIRTAVTAENDIQIVANQMMDTIISGAGSPLEGLLCATRIYAIDTSNYGYITFGNCDGVGRYVRFDISSIGAADSLYRKLVNDMSNPLPSSATDDLDYNDKIDLESGSRFYYYDSGDNITTDPDDATRVMICLEARSSLAAISRTIILYNSAKIRNIYDID